jgi:hypothetical protein
MENEGGGTSLLVKGFEADMAAPFGGEWLPTRSDSCLRCAISARQVLLVVILQQVASLLTMVDCSVSVPLGADGLL